MPCNVLQPPSTFYSSYFSPSPSSSSSPTPPPPPPPSCLLPFSFSLLLSPLLLYSPLSFPRRGGVRSKFNFHRATPLTYHPLFLSVRQPPPFPSSFVLSSSPSIRETLRTRARKPPAAFLAINYAAQLFTGISCASV